MNPYHNLDVDTKTHEAAVVKAIDALKRGVWTLCIIFVIFTIVVGSDSNATHSALCKLRDNASARASDNQKLLQRFTDKELQQKFHISRKDAEAQLARDQKAVAALADVDCGGWWFF